MEQVILPEMNRSNYMEIDLNVRRKLKAHFVSHYSEVFPLVFSEVAEIFDPRQNYRSEREGFADMAS